MKKSFWIFQKGGFFPIAYFFSGKTAFLQISADFVTKFQKLFFYLKALQTRMQIDEKNFFIAQVVSEISAKNTYFKNRQMYIFVTDCISASRKFARFIHIFYYWLLKSRNRTWGWTNNKMFYCRTLPTRYGHWICFSLTWEAHVHLSISLQIDCWKHTKSKLFI